MEQKITTILHMALGLALDQGMIQQSDRQAILNDFYNRVDKYKVNRKIAQKPTKTHPVGGGEDHKEIKELAFNGVKLQ